MSYFYPRSPCGERLSFRRNNNTGCIFLSTLSLRRATRMYEYQPTKFDYFYPRSPCGERRNKNLHLKRLKSIFLSTLSLRRATPSLYQLYDTYAFLSTLSLRRATFLRGLFLSEFFISIHALLAESDAARPERQRTLRHFYPRSPCGERPWPAAA